MVKTILLKHRRLYFFILFFLLLSNQKFYAQGVPMGFNYQAVVRNNQGLPIINKQVKLKISIIKTNASGIIVYEEDHDTKTNQFGLVNLIVGKGAKTGGTLNFANIPWGADNFFVEIGLNVDNNWMNLGTAQLQSVPYALTSGNTQGLGKYAISGIDPTDSQVLKYNATLKQWEPAAMSGSGSVTNVFATAPLSISGNAGISPVISIPPAGAFQNGYLIAADWNTFNQKQNPLIAGSNIVINGNTISGTANAITNANANGVTISGNTLTISTASGTSYGLLSPQDWTTFNNKLGTQPTILGLGNITVTGSYPLYSIEGSGSSVTTSANANGVTISGNTLTISTASGTSYGLLSPQDWNTFNSKQDLLVAGSNITINGNTISGTGAGLPIISLTPGVSIIGNLLSINNASGITNGLLTSADWNIFNNKQNTIVAGAGISISGGNTIINTKPDQIVSLTGVGVVSVSGLYPSFSINAPQVNISAGSGVSITGAFPNYTISSNNTGAAGTFDNGRVSTILGVITNFGNDLINSNLTLNDTDGDILIYQFNLPLVKKIRPSTIIEVELNAPTFLDDIKKGAIASFTIIIAAQNPTWGGIGFLSDNGKQNYTPLFLKGYYDNIGAGVSLNVSIYLKVIGSGGQIKIKDTTNILNDNNGGGYILIRETY